MKIIQRLFLILLLLSETTACQLFLKEFQPKKDSLFKITFSYPASWKWEDNRPYDELPPGEEPPPSERMIVKNGALAIQVYKPANPQAQMQEWMDSYLAAVATMLRSDNTIQIDGYDARWITVVYPPQNTGQPHVSEGIYLLTKDRFYIIDFSIPESETDGRSYKEFEKFIKTIKVLPELS